MIRDPTRVISSLNPISDDEEWELCPWEEEEESCFDEGSYSELYFMVIIWEISRALYGCPVRFSHT